MFGKVSQPVAGSARSQTSLWVWAGVLLILIFAGGVRARLCGTPLERDEGEYAYTGQLMLQGIPPYQLSYFMKLPGVHMAYALMMAVFGQTAAGMHLGFLVINGATIVLMFLLGRKWLGNAGGLAACATYALMSLSASVLGFAAHATHFVVLFAVAGMLLLPGDDAELGRPARFFLSGLLFGLAFLMKQPGLFFMGFGLFMVLLPGMRSRPVPWAGCVRRAIPFLCGGMLPLLLTGLWLWRAGVFERFLFWTITCVRAYGANTSLVTGLDYLSHYFRYWAKSNLCFWVLAGTGCVGLMVDRKTGRTRLLLIGLLICSVLATIQGWNFRPHYFVLMLPVVALLVGSLMERAQQWGLRASWGRAGRLFPAGAFVGLAVAVIAAQSDFFFRLTSDEVTQKMYGGHPFLEARVVAGFVKEQTAAGDRVAVIGSEPEIYFYSRRHSATGYIYTYDLMEATPYARKMQEDMIQEIESARPEVIVFVNVPSSWNKTANSDMLVMDWGVKYCREFYDVIGVVEITPGKPSHYYWGAEAAAQATGEGQFMYVLKRQAGRG